MWVIGLILGMICSGCIAIVPAGEDRPPTSPPMKSSSEERSITPPPVKSSSEKRSSTTPPIKSSSEERSITPPPMESSQQVRHEAKATPPTKVEPELKKALYFHTVKWSGETVSIISAWYTGDQQNWKALTQANPQLNILQICEGNKILIPDHLLKTREPLPREFVRRFYSKPKKEKSLPKTEEPQVQDEEPKLFGPKKYPAK
jgi:hypothetical protein